MTCACAVPAQHNKATPLKRALNIVLSIVGVAPPPGWAEQAPPPYHDRVSKPIEVATRSNHCSLPLSLYPSPRGAPPGEVLLRTEGRLRFVNGDVRLLRPDAAR